MFNNTIRPGAAVAAAAHWIATLIISVTSALADHRPGLRVRHLHTVAFLAVLFGDQVCERTKGHKLEEISYRTSGRVSAVSVLLDQHESAMGPGHLVDIVAGQGARRWSTNPGVDDQTLRVDTREHAGRGERRHRRPGLELAPRINEGGSRREWGAGASSRGRSTVLSPPTCPGGAEPLGAG